ncbi:MAG TPA: hypothetical protein VH877_13800 [Polyangia bacterium]|jgi:hypothetical protein|nr:hypothetical protein [Polyangia bacterium]
MTTKTLTLAELRHLARAVLVTAPEELDCDACLAEFDRLAEIALAGQAVPEALRLVEEHLGRCPDCHEEFQALLAALRALGAGGEQG